MSDTPGQSPLAPLEKGSAPSPLSKPAASVDALARATEFGSTAPKGKPRADGLPPGSDAARAADRAKEAKRQAEYRARVRAANPPPLPSKPTTFQSAPDALSDAVVSDSGSPFVPWDTSVLAPLFEEIVPAVEQEAVASLTNRAAKAQLPAPLLKQIEKDAHWSTAAKKSLTVTGPQVAAKWLNKLGVSAENQGEVVLALAVASIAFTHFRLSRKLDALIADRAKEKQNVPTSPGADKLVQFQAKA